MVITGRSMEYPGCSIHSSCFISFACLQHNNNSRNCPVRFERLLKGTSIWYNHDDDDCYQDLYIIRSGLMVCIRYSDTGEMNSYLLLGKRQTIGEMCLFASIKIPFVVTALTDVEVCRINADFIERIILEHPGFSRNIFNAILNNVNAILKYTDMLETKNTYERVKRMLFLMVDSIGECNQEVKLSLTHKDLAALVCADRVTVTKILRQMQNEGLLMTGNRNIIVRPVINPERIGSG